MITMASLVTALGATRAPMITFVGAGGKSTAILRTASELSALGRTTILTTTTLVGGRLGSYAPHEFVPDGAAADDDALNGLAARITSRLAPAGAVFLAAGTRSDGKFVGVAPELLDALLRRRVVDCILVEGDGARALPIKMPAKHEPVIPRESAIVVPVAGLDAIGRRVAEGVVHRPELFAALTDDPVVTTDTLVAVLASERGGMKGVPPRAAVRPILNKMSAVGPDRARAAALGLLRTEMPALDRVIVGDLRLAQLTVYEPCDLDSCAGRAGEGS